MIESPNFSCLSLSNGFVYYSNASVWCGVRVCCVEHIARSFACSFALNIQLLAYFCIVNIRRNLGGIVTKSVASIAGGGGEGGDHPPIKKIPGRGYLFT